MVKIYPLCYNFGRKNGTIYLKALAVLLLTQPKLHFVSPRYWKRVGDTLAPCALQHTNFKYCLKC
jgi:hypothetical protein